MRGYMGEASTIHAQAAQGEAMTEVHICRPRIDYYLARAWLPGDRKPFATKRFGYTTRKLGAEARARDWAAKMVSLQCNRADVLGCEREPGYQEPVCVFSVRSER